MFESLIDRFAKLKRKLFGIGRISHKELAEFLHDLRLVLLESDVNYLVVKDFINQIETKGQSLKLAQAINPADLLLKLVYDELVTLLGKEHKLMNFSGCRIIK